MEMGVGNVQGKELVGKCHEADRRTETFVSETRNPAQNEGSRTSAVGHRLPIKGVAE